MFVDGVILLLWQALVICNIVSFFVLFFIIVGILAWVCVLRAVYAISQTKIKNICTKISEYRHKLLYLIYPLTMKHILTKQKDL